MTTTKALSNSFRRVGQEPAGSDSPVSIEARAVSKVFPSSAGNDAFTALQDVSLTVREGSFVCFVGPSGCGKTTLLNMMAGLDRPSTGTVYQNGIALRGPNTGVGYITQKDNLLPWRTVERNVGLALELRGVEKRDRKPYVDEALARVGLEGFARHYPSQLSGGMKKRASLARTLVYQPETLLMDEPFAAVDAQLRASLHVELLKIWEEQRTTVVFVTHDLEEALLLGDEVIVFGTKPGRVLHSATVPFPRPRDIFELRTSGEFWSLWRELWEWLAAGEGHGEQQT